MDEAVAHKHNKPVKKTNSDSRGTSVCKSQETGDQKEDLEKYGEKGNREGSGLLS